MGILDCLDYKYGNVVYKFGNVIRQKMGIVIFLKKHFYKLEKNTLTTMENILIFEGRENCKLM